MQKGWAFHPYLLWFNGLETEGLCWGNPGNSGRILFLESKVKHKTIWVFLRNRLQCVSWNTSKVVGALRTYCATSIGQIVWICSSILPENNSLFKHNKTPYYPINFARVYLFPFLTFIFTHIIQKKLHLCINHIKHLINSLSSRFIEGPM